MADGYISSFQKFLSHTNEKQVLLKEIAGVIEKNSAKSLLDIGAGNGLLAIPLSKKVGRYVAVETKEKYIQTLQEAEIDVVSKKFPCSIKETFDLVLISHSLSYSTYESFLKTAWELVNPGGTLLIITYRGQEDDWTHLMKSLGIKIEDFNRKKFNEIIELLYSLGDVKTRKVITTVNTKSLDDMVQALSFVFVGDRSYLEAEFSPLCKKLETILKSNYATATGFTFPFQHFFIATKKK